MCEHTYITFKSGCVRVCVMHACMHSLMHTHTHSLVDESHILTIY